MWTRWKKGMPLSCMCGRSVSDARNRTEYGSESDGGIKRRED
mgnify:CR=1 FL=1